MPAMNRKRSIIATSTGLKGIRRSVIAPRLSHSKIFSAANLEEMKMMTKKSSRTIRAALFFRRMLIICLILLVGACAIPFSANAFDVHLGTGEPGSFSHFSGRTICRIINKQVGDLHCTVAPADSDVHNLTNLQGGSLDVCLTDSRMLYDAISGKGNFEFFDISYDNLREMVTLYDVPISLVVRENAGITTLDNLKGKRVNAGAPRSPQHFVVDTLMGIKNWSNEDFSLLDELSPSLSQDTMAFCHGTIQAMVHIGVHPDPALQQLLSLCQARLLTLSQADMGTLLNSHPAFIRAEIPAGTYSSFPEKVTTFGTQMKLVTSNNLDEETVYTILDALYSDRNALKKAHPTLGEFMGSESDKGDTGIKRHSGAVKFFVEQGF